MLDTTRTPKRSFYHHFNDKEDFALQVLDTYMSQVHAGIDARLRHTDRPPLTRVRDFFEMTQKSYREKDYMGCLIGGLGQELSSVSDVFREKISQCFSEIASEMAICLKEARQLGELPKDTNVQEMAERLVDCWEGAALRSRLQRTPASLNSMLDFYFLAVTGVRQRQDAS